MPLLSLSLAAVLLASTAEQGVRKTPERLRLEESLENYHALIDAYSKSDDKSVTEIGTWEQKRLTEVVGAVHPSGDGLREWDEGRFKAAGTRSKYV